MPTIRFSRQFSSGSRPTADPFDQFLDSVGFYRKHTPRDSTNLFRVASEQLYDTQDHHAQIRKDCVNFMIKHREQYEAMIQSDFDQYIRSMAKTETPGTLMELRAIGHLYKRNIRLFQPFKLAIFFVQDDDYTEPVLRVFHASFFDSVFEKSYVEDAAFCQSIVYETLYKKVFKLPDVEYAAETMLHSDINHEPNRHEYELGDEFASHIVFEDGRKFELDRPEDTNCILSDPKRCHFHNEDFEEEIMKNGSRQKAVLSDKYNSCVRQLLIDGITPFPYKVAKGLDENMYRNIEFDSWNEKRYLERMKKNYLQIGVDCLVRLSGKDDKPLKCRINAKGSNDETYVVFVEKLCETRTVPLASLQPLSGMERDMYAARHCDQYAKSEFKRINTEKSAVSDIRNVKPYAKSQNDNLISKNDAICKSIDLEQYINLSNFDYPSKIQHQILAYPIYSQTPNMSTNTNSGSHNNNTSKIIKNRNQNQHNVQCDANDKQTQQQSQITKVDEENTYNVHAHEPKQDFQQKANTTTGYYHHQSQDQNIDAGVSMNQQHQVPGYYAPGMAPVYYCSTAEYNEQNLYSSDMVMPHGVYALPHAYQAPPMQPAVYAPVANQGSHYQVPVGSWSGYNPAINAQGYVISAPPQYALPIQSQIPFQLPFISRDLINSKGRINFNLNYAFAPTGDDLPLNDKVSVRFFYNLGIEYFKLFQHVYGYGQVMAMIDGEPNATNNSDQQTPNDLENQVIPELQNLNFGDFNDNEIPSPSKPRNYTEYGYGRRGSSVKYGRRNDNRSNTGKNFQGSFQGPITSSKPFPKNNQQKFSNNQGGNANYDSSTPIKENGGKSYQHQHGQHGSKRDQPNVDNDISNGNSQHFGFHVPPFPYFGDAPEQHYGPPGHAYPRMTPPVSGRSSSASVATPGQYFATNQVHGNYTMPTPPPPGMQQHQHQQQQHQQHQQHQQQQQQQQSQSLNTSSASNPSQ